MLKMQFRCACSNRCGHFGRCGTARTSFVSPSSHTAAAAPSACACKSLCVACVCSANRQRRPIPRASFSCSSSNEYGRCVFFFCAHWTGLFSRAMALASPQNVSPGSSCASRCLCAALSRSTRPLRSPVCAFLFFCCLSLFHSCSSDSDQIFFR